MNKKILTTILLTLIIMTGCGSDKEPVELVTVEPETILIEDTQETETEEEVESFVITDREVVDGKMQSYLTGEWKDEKIVKRRSMAVMIPNNKGAMPQYGISAASIIYEAPVEGRITRLMAFIEDYDDLDHIGPIRSSRDYYVYEAMPYDSIYCNWGLAVPFVADLINSDRIDNVSQAVKGISKPAVEAFDNITRSGYKQEYTGYMFINGYNKAIERLGYEKEYRDTFEQAFTFAKEPRASKYEEYPDATIIYPGGTTTNGGGYGNAKPYFEYDEKDGLYYRYQFGSAHKDEMNGEHLTVSNVIFKICHGEVRNEQDYLAFGVHGEGDAIVFTGGKAIKGTWKRNSDTEANMFYDDKGEEIIFNQGKTWICNIWKEYSEHMSYE